MGATVVEKVRFGVIISDPFLKLNAERPNKFAEDPEFTIKPYFFPKSLQICASSFLTFWPSIKLKLSFFKTFITAFISFWSYTALP